MKTLKILFAVSAVLLALASCSISKEYLNRTGNKDDISQYQDIFDYLATNPNLIVKGNSVSVKGVESFSGNNAPLILVDGFEVSNIATIPVTEISDVTVLRTPAECAPYGFRGGSGVILITLKKK